MVRFLVVLFSTVCLAALAAPLNLVVLHAKAGERTNKECLACHAAILKETSLKAGVKSFHRRHLESKNSSAPKNCADCHEKVDLREVSAGALRKQVNPDLCAGCHGKDSEIKALYAE